MGTRRLPRRRPPRARAPSCHAAARGERDELARQLAVAQVELGVYRQVDVYSATLRRTVEAAVEAAGEARDAAAAEDGDGELEGEGYGGSGSGQLDLLLAQEEVEVQTPAPAMYRRQGSSSRRNG